MKGPSSSMEVCPFCGKTFKRLKSHLPYCKMAETRNRTPETDCGGKSITAKSVHMQRTDATLPVVENQNLKVKGKSKSAGFKSQLWQDQKITSSQTIQPKVGKVASGNTMTQKKAGVTTGQSRKALVTTTRTSQGVTLTKQLRQDQLALTESNTPIQNALILSPDLDRTVPANVDSPRTGNTLPSGRDQENLEGSQARLSLPDSISAQDTIESAIKYIEGRGDFQGLFDEQVNQNSGPKSLSGSTKASMDFGRPTGFSQERDKMQIPGISPILCNIEAEMCKIKALRTIEKSLEIKVDMLSPPKTGEILDGPLGLQWIPQLYSSYVQLQIVPGKQDQWYSQGRGTKTFEPMGRLPGSVIHELCKAGCEESIIEEPSTSKSLMDVRLGELPAWLTKRNFSLKKFPEFIANAWDRYNNKYINVRKGGIGGLTMILAGYCILSYTWNYDHIKQYRWRKYH